MIKTFVRHTILEFCIEILFNQVNKNFPSDLDPAKLFIGEYINVKVKVDDADYLLERCRVEHVRENYAILKYESSDRTLFLITNGTDLLDIKGKDEIVDEYFHSNS